MGRLVARCRAVWAPGSTARGGVQVVEESVSAGQPEFGGACRRPDAPVITWVKRHRRAKRRQRRQPVVPGRTAAENGRGPFGLPAAGVAGGGEHGHRGRQVEGDESAVTPGLHSEVPSERVVFRRRAVPRDRRTAHTCRARAGGPPTWRASSAGRALPARSSRGRRPAVRGGVADTPTARPRLAHRAVTRGRAVVGPWPALREPGATDRRGCRPSDGHRVDGSQGGAGGLVVADGEGLLALRGLAHAECLAVHGRWAGGPPVRTPVYARSVS
jgi:hypothetical protein